MKEYKILRYAQDIEKDLSDLAFDGWKVKHCYENHNDYSFFLERTVSFERLIEIQSESEITKDND